MQPAAINSHRSFPAPIRVDSDPKASPAPLPDFALGAGALPGPDISPNLVNLVAVAAERNSTFERASNAADSASKGDVDLRHAERAADAALTAAVQNVIHQPATSLQDVLAKFSVVKDTAELEDIALQMERPGSTQTERMLWSICADLIELSNSNPVPRITPSKHTACRVADMADQFRRAIDKFTAVEEASEQPESFCTRNLLDQLTQREQFLKTAASHERATSVKGALFQIGVVDTLVKQAIHTTAWRKLFGADPDVAFDPPTEVMALEEQIYRLLYSAADVIARSHGIPRREYASDYFLSRDPFKPFEA